MEQLKDRWLRLLNESDDDDEQQADNVPTQTMLEAVDTSTEALAQDDDLPLYTATEAEREFWRQNAFKEDALQDLLRPYDLDGYPPNRNAFSHFRIGFDEKRHFATFFVDAKRYHIIAFDRNNSAPIDDAEARRVLERISELRRQRSRLRLIDGELFERFDDVENICAALSR